MFLFSTKMFPFLYIKMETFQIFYMIIIILIISYCLYISSQNQKERHSVDGESDYLIDPLNLKKIHVCSHRGRQLMHLYMRCYFEEFLKKTQGDWNYILPTELHRSDLSKYYLLDVRKPEDYLKGHIPGSVNIYWLDLMRSENINKLPKDRQIIIICYVGHTASQILVLLKLLGYNVKVLKFGMGMSPKMGIPVAGWLNYGYDITQKVNNQ
jgi:rhodanese-related sulfurtransferase